MKKILLALGVSATAMLAFESAAMAQEAAAPASETAEYDRYREVHARRELIRDARRSRHAVLDPRRYPE